MSTERAVIVSALHGKISITQYRSMLGQAIQITHQENLGNTDAPGFVQLTPLDAYRVIVELTKWLKDNAKANADNIQKQIDANIALKNTILQDAVNCEKFIRELDIIEVPLRLL